MAEITADKADKVEENTRRYMREAEDAAQSAFRVGNDLLTTTTYYYFDSLNRMMRGTVEITTKTQRTIEDMLTVYRKVYTDGVKSWEEYVDKVNKTFVRPSK
jgi:hypothetical protein